MPILVSVPLVSKTALIQLEKHKFLVYQQLEPDVGGIPDMVDHGKSGLLYRFEEFEMLAFFIQKIFKNDDLALALSLGSKIAATKRHDRKNNLIRMVSIYQNVLHNTSRSTACTTSSLPRPSGSRAASASPSSPRQSATRPRRAEGAPSEQRRQGRRRPATRGRWIVDRPPTSSGTATPLLPMARSSPKSPR